MLEEEHNLIQLAKTGDKGAFGRLYDHYLPQIYRFIYLKTSGRQDAEDLTHEVFLSAWQHIPEYKESGFPLSSWLYQIARNRIIDHFRTKRNNIPIDDYLENDNDIDAPHTAEDDVDVNLALATVQEAMKKLREDYQTLLIMRFVEDRSTAEVSIVLGKSEGAIRLIQHRALHALKQIIDHEKHS
jgi:RNA polymerase sigma-70 factor, ECF subfamily